MGAVVEVTPASIRAFAALPDEVPDTLLGEHLATATRDLSRQTGLQEPGAGQELDWAEALTVRALASTFPWLNTFALSGAAKVGRLEGSVEYRFLTPDEVAERVDDLMRRFEELVGRLSPADPETPGHAALGGVTMIAI